MGKMIKKDLVTVVCYGEERTMERKDALRFYLQGMMCSEGSEHERYETIFFQLSAGRSYASDELDWRG